MKRRSFMEQPGIGRNGISFDHGLHVTTTHLNTHAGTTWTQSRGTYACYILSQSQRGSATQKAERLTISFVNLHAGHTSIVLRRGDKLHAEGGTQVRLFIDNFIDSFYVHVAILAS